MGHPSGPRAGKTETDHDLTEHALRTIMRGMRFFRLAMEPFFSTHGINLSQWVVMRIIHAREKETGEPVRLVDLSTLLMIRQPTLTTLISKLMLQGLVEYAEPPEKNRRGRLVRLSPAGRKAMDRMAELHGEKISELFSVWDTNDKKRIIMLFEELETHLLRHLPRDTDKRVRPYGNTRASTRSEL
jgi:DNA-binding MarR family transcriptional regulator